VTLAEWLRAVAVAVVTFLVGVVVLLAVFGPPPEDIDCPPAAGETYDYGWQPC
jgi:hypothetical protein